MNTAGERIIPTELRNEMSRSYLEYAMSVIVGRALPDARDGLKPVHRRILYAMHELGLTADRPFRKCARVVGEVLGKYHPHGDNAVYEALVRMAQDFSMRAPLISGHGNFGSIDNDPPAAMRYTECRLQQLTSDALLRDIDAETVDFLDNFDGSQQEPIVLPARVPQLLLNGAAGIAVGMATNIPPHNLGELADGLIAFIRNPEISDEQLRRIIPGPDFPTGGKILGVSGIRDAYTTGKGSIIMRGVAEIETIGTGGRSERDAIVVTELPYQTNKAALIEKIADLVNDKQLEGISDIRDESDREGLRIVIELKRDANPRVVLNNLYKHTPLQTNFGCNLLALVDGKPQLLNLKQYLEVFLEFRVETITRRTRYELRKAQERDLILQGLLVALEHLDAVIALIRHAESPAVARQELVENYGLVEPQADAILQMQLRRLTALETEKIQQEHEQLQEKIADLQDILARRERVLGLVESEIEEIKAKHNTPRRTVIEKEEGELDDIDLIANEPSIVLLTEQGYIKRMPLNTFGTQSRATRGKSATNLKDSDSIAHFFNCRDHDGILFFSERGIVYSLRAYQIPMGSRTARGVPLVQMLPISRDEKITSVIPVRDFTEDDYLVMLTKGGNIKRTALSAFKNIRTNGLIAISLEEEDQLRWVRRARADDSILIGSRLGMAIHFQINNEQLRPRGRVTRGVKAMNLQPEDELVGMDIFPSSVIAEFLNADSETSDAQTSFEEEDANITPENEESDASTKFSTGTEEDPYVLAITQQGYGKRVAGSQFRLQRRAGKGTIATKFRKANDRLAALRIVKSADELMLITHRGIIIRYSAGQIPTQSKQATGVRVQRLDEDDFIVAVTPVPPMDMEEETEAQE